MTTPSMIRAMANTLHDHGVNPIDETTAAVILIRTGFPAKLIEQCFDKVLHMAFIRRANEQRRMPRGCALGTCLATCGFCYYKKDKA